ncbi:solute carrier family 22 member 7-like [Haemaphysalis longicornis]
MNVLQLSILLSKDLLTCESFDCYDVFKHGPFQRRLLLFRSLAFFLMNANSFVLHLITSDVGHWCKRPPHSNMSAAPWITSAIPLEPDGSLSRCLRFEHPDEPNNTNTIPCEEWEVEQQLASTTIVSEWNLVCQRRSLITVLVLVHNGACAMFAIAAGSLADSAGRFRVLLVVIITLLVSTAAACLSDSYVVYASLRFFVGGSAAVTMALSLVALFEVTTHAKRPLHIVLAGTVRVVFSDLWYVGWTPVQLGWKLKQMLFVLPTLLLLPALPYIEESPRWLTGQGRLRSAEDVMLSAAKSNIFPTSSTAWLHNKLKGDMSTNAARLTTIQDLLHGLSIRQRALFLCFSFFSITLAAFAIFFSPLHRRSVWLHLPSFLTTLAVYAVMHVLIRRLTMLAVISGWFMVIGILQCLMRIAVGAGFLLASEVLLILAKAFYYFGSVLCFVYAIELFPSAVRGTAACWTFACGRLGAVVTSVTLVLQKVGREDAAFAFSGALLFAAVLAMRRLPHETTVECAESAARRASTVVKRRMDHMKQTIKERPEEPGKPKSSHECGKSPGKSSRRSLGRSSGRSSGSSSVFRLAMKSREKSPTSSHKAPVKESD